MQGKTQNEAIGGSQNGQLIMETLNDLDTLYFQYEINHAILKVLFDPIRALYDDVKRKALMRLEYEGLHKAEAITTVGARFHNDPAGFAMDRYAYYVCFKCE